MTRPRDIGTRAETAIVRTARQFGFPHAERKPLYGSRDQADVALCPGVLIESKAGKAAETASDNQIGEWMGEAEASRVNAGAAFCFLVTKRKGVGAPRARRWWAHTTLDVLLSLVDVPVPYSAEGVYVRLTLGELLTMLKREGW